MIVSYIERDRKTHHTGPRARGAETKRGRDRKIARPQGNVLCIIGDRTACGKFRTQGSGRRAQGQVLQVVQVSYNEALA